MSAAGLLASWLALLFGGWSFVSALGAPDANPALRDSAARALWVAAAGAASAAAILCFLLVDARLDVSYVARHISLNLPSAYRLAAVLSAPAGAVLPAAALVAAAGAWRARGSTLGVAISAATVVALLAASVAAPPFARLDWLPAEGMGMPPSMQELATVASRVFVLLAVAGAATSAAVAADGVADSGAKRMATEGAGVGGVHHLERLLAATAAAMVLAVVLGGEGALSSGASPSASPVAAARAMLVVPLISLVLAWRARSASAAAALLGTVGLLGGTLVTILAPGGTRIPSPLLALAAASLGAATLASLAGAVQRPAPVARSLDVIASLALAAAGGALLVAQEKEELMATWPLPVFLSVSIVAAGASAWRLRQGGVAAGPVGASMVVAGSLLGAAGVWLMGGGATDAVWWGVVAGAAMGVSMATLPSFVALRAPAAWLGTVAGVALALASLAAAGEVLARQRLVRLTSGGTAEVETRYGAQLRVTHQGISRYQDANAHVVALAIELTRGGAPVLVTAERREFVDAREASLGAVVARPGTFATPLEQVRMSLEEVAPDESVSLRVVTVPLAIGWRLAAAATVLVAALAWLAPRQQSPGNVPDGSFA